MSTSIEDLVRAAQQEQANRAVHPQRILAALPQRRAQLARRRRLTVVVAAAAVVAVLAIPVVTLANRGAGPVPQPAVSPTVSVSPSAAAQAPPTPLRFKPTWLPEGYAEYRRGSIQEVTLSRLWMPDRPDSALLGESPILFLNVTPDAGGEAQSDAGEEQVDVNGTAGVYLPAEHIVSWRVGQVGLSVGTAQLSLSKSTLLRVARSVRPDTAALELPFRLPALPGDMKIFARSVSGSAPDHWLAELSLTSTTNDPQSSVTISVGTVTEAPKGGVKLTVAGRPARYVKSPRAGYYLVVNLGAGRQTTVLGIGLDKAAMITLAEGVRLVETPDLGWIGE